MDHLWTLKMKISSFFMFTILIFLSTALIAEAVHVPKKPVKHTEEERKPYIVYMGHAENSKTPTIHHHHHHRLLHEVIGDEDIAKRERIRSVGKSFNAFAANLLPTEAKRLRERESVVSVFPSTMRKPRTTRSWDFLQMPLSLKRDTQRESDVIVGVFDTGIYMDAPSFNDKGFGPPPSKWKGTCHKAANFSGCNNKVIGARAYSINQKQEVSPVDTEGHGTHTSSTVAGVEVPGASLYGLGKGTARGGVPLARLAIYKVCWAIGCSDIDIMAAFDDALDDGVDMISISLGGMASSYFEDLISIGTFHAMKKGIFVSLAAGNDGMMSTVENLAPWMMTVGASGMDRQFRTPFALGNGVNMSGISLNTFKLEKMYPLITGEQASNHRKVPYSNAKVCDTDTLDEEKVKGKIILCGGPPMFQDYNVKELGGVGVLISYEEELKTAHSFIIPTSIIDIKQEQQIYKYINSTKNPVATISKSIEVKVTAPFLAAYSSRGPNMISPTILKPDVVAPGTDILAAYTKFASMTGNTLDNRYGVYNIISGTSMATPHVTAAAAYIKTFHPYWSPAAIRSALMTTATQLKVPDPAAALGYGAGQINPTAAVDPGLIYDLTQTDYIRFLCHEGYSGTVLQLVTDEVIENCSTVGQFGGHDVLNYPSMFVLLEDPNATISASFNRVVTNVGPFDSVYRATVKADEGLNVTVSPSILIFKRLYQRKSFVVTVTGKPLGKSGAIRSAWLEWVDSESLRRVRSPIVASTPHEFGTD